MKRNLLWSGRTGVLELTGANGNHRLEIGWVAGDTQRLDANVLEVESGAYSVVVGNRSYEARVVPGPNGSWQVTVDGLQFPLELVDPRNSAGRSAGSAKQGRLNVAAPMPGKVVRVLVAAGDTVEAGQGLVVVEAMKMQNEMKAPRAGKVVALTTRAGATVGAGDTLVTLE